MNALLSRAALSLFLAACVAAPGAWADQSSAPATLTATTNSYTFSGNPDYGPWTVQSLEYRLQLPDDAPAVTLLDRNDDDHPVASGSRAFYLDDYHTFSKRFYVYAQVGAADGTLLPYRTAYLEGDVKLTNAFVLAAGGAAMQNPDGTTTRYASIGPAIYSGRVALMLRFMPSNTNGVGTAATQVSLQYNDPRHDQIVLAFLDGREPNVLAGLPPSAAGFQKVTQATLTIKHWVSPGAGFVLGISGGNFTGITSAANSYRQRGLTFGVFLAAH